MQLLAHHLDARVVWKFEVVHAGHHRWEEVVRVHVALERLANDRQRRRQRFETYKRKLLYKTIVKLKNGTNKTTNFTDINWKIKNLTYHQRVTADFQSKTAQTFVAPPYRTN